MNLFPWAHNTVAGDVPAGGGISHWGVRVGVRGDPAHLPGDAAAAQGLGEVPVPPLQAGRRC